jgi:hypothetical protein
MEESYECDVATHIGPESCGAAREGGVEQISQKIAEEKNNPAYFVAGREMLVEQIS